MKNMKSVELSRIATQMAESHASDSLVGASVAAADADEFDRCVLRSELLEEGLEATDEACEALREALREALACLAAEYAEAADDDDDQDDDDQDDDDQDDDDQDDDDQDDDDQDERA